MHTRRGRDALAHARRRPRRKPARRESQRVQVGLALAQVAPLPLVHDHAAHPLAGADRLQKARHHRLDHPRPDEPEERRRDEVDAGELATILPLRPQRPAQVDHPPRFRVVADPSLGAPRPQHQRDRIAATEMSIPRLAQGQIGQDVPVVDHEGSVRRQPVPHVVDPPGGVQQHRLVAKPDGPPPVFALRKRFHVALREVMSVHEKGSHPQVLDEMIERVGDERAIVHRDQRLGPILRERAQARAQGRPRG